MIRTLLEDQSYWGAALGLMLFLGVFVGTVAWMFRPGARKAYAHGAALPLDDGTRIHRSQMIRQIRGADRG